MWNAIRLWTRVGVSISYDVTCTYLVYFLCFMAYQPSGVIQCQSHPCKRTEVDIISLIAGGDKGVQYPFSKVNDSMTGVWTHFKATVLHFSHYVIKTSPLCVRVLQCLMCTCHFNKYKSYLITYRSWGLRPFHLCTLNMNYMILFPASPVWLSGSKFGTRPSSPRAYFST